MRGAALRSAIPGAIEDLIHPFNFDARATQAYTPASDERPGQASTASQAIVAVGLLPLMILSCQIMASRKA